MSKLLFTSLRSIFARIDASISRIFYLGHPALAVDLCPSAVAAQNQANQVSTADDAKSLIDSIFDGLFLAAVPKYRRSRERRATRRLGKVQVSRWMTPRFNLVECLECGSWHESHTICGECYSKVREETEAMRAKMDVNARLYNVPHSEVAYVYKDETDDRQKHDGKYIVEMEKSRPEWFPKNLLTKGHGKY